jgi:hypothetical protein
MKENRGDEPIQDIIYMEISQGNSPCSYLKQEKCHFFSSTNFENRRQNRSCWGRGSWSQWVGRRWWDWVLEGV